jgi:hypothetical protein
MRTTFPRQTVPGVTVDFTGGRPRVTAREDLPEVPADETWADPEVDLFKDEALWDAQVILDACNDPRVQTLARRLRRLRVRSIPGF